MFALAVADGLAQCGPRCSFGRRAPSPIGCNHQRRHIFRPIGVRLFEQWQGSRRNRLCRDRAYCGNVDADCANRHGDDAFCHRAPLAKFACETDHGPISEVIGLRGSLFLYN